MEDFKKLTLKNYIKKVCKSCNHFHNAGHNNKKNELIKFNEWCCNMGRPCSKAVGECKINNNYSSLK